MSESQKHLFYDTLDIKKIPHALVFIGSDFTWMLDSALNLVKKLLDEVEPGNNHGSKIDNLTHPDVHIINPASKTGLYSIEQIKEICDQSHLYPHEAARQCFILKHADRMQEAACNALLKTLEEPTKETFFILIVKSSDQMPATLLSRLQQVVFDADSSKEQSKEYYQKLEQFLTQWPNWNYNDIYLICEEVQKQFDEEFSKQKVDDDAEVSFQDQDTLDLIAYIEKWYHHQKPPNKTDSDLPFFKAIENAQLGAMRSIKIAVCLENILLSLHNS